ERYYVTSTGIPGKYLCRYGRFSHELFIKSDRIREASYRSMGANVPSSIEEACERIAAGMKKVAADHGAEKTAVFISPEATNEEMYLAGRIAREGLGTSNVSSLSILQSGNGSGELDDSLGVTASTSDRGCIGDADLIICNNTAMESDHLVLASEVIGAVRKGAKLIVTNSTLDPADQLLSTLAMDPMRGRAAALWNGITQVLVEDGTFDRKKVGSIDGADRFVEGLDFGIDRLSALTGIDAKNIEEAAGIIRDASKVVIIHSPDRPQDNAPGDLSALGNLVILLRAAGRKADLLLPRSISNSAGLEVTGADPEFAPGRSRDRGAIPGAATRRELLSMLKGGELKGAIVIGEDPMAWDSTGRWLQNVEFLAVMDWTGTETTSLADVVLPGSTYLETSGTRCNFEGKVLEYFRASRPPAGVDGREVLSGLAGSFGIALPADITAELDSKVKAQLGPLAAYYWNKGEERPGTGVSRLRKPESDTTPAPIAPPLAHSVRYRKEIREVGTERFRVR
ncbi:MAG TPA: molybdopterin-dependent oxidoreductase, partial [Candidatus Krumholzibacterium sp.]|nr:molybdopterin-dependent oxidoreductase [Candidatus Krumholzibacterium sp.]